MKRDLKERFKGMALAAALAAVGCNSSVVNGLALLEGVGKDLTTLAILGGTVVAVNGATGFYNWWSFDPKDLADESSTIYKKLKDAKVSGKTLKLLEKNTKYSEALKDKLQNKDDNLIDVAKFVSENGKDFTKDQIHALSVDIHDVLDKDNLFRLRLLGDKQKMNLL